MRKAADRLVPVSTSERMSVSSRVIFGLVLPRATMSNDWISGTPARIMVESWRVKTAMSFCLIALPPLMRRFFTLLTITPWRRRLALTIASPPARISPRTGLPFLSLPSHSKTMSLIRLLCSYVPLPYVFEDRTPPLRFLVCYSFVTEISSSSVVMPERTLIRPDWRRSRTPSRWACSAMSIAVPDARMILWISSLIGMTW